MGCQLARSSFLAGRRDLSSWGAIALVVVLMEDLKIVFLPCPNRGYISNIAAEDSQHTLEIGFEAVRFGRFGFLRKRAARATGATAIAVKTADGSEDVFKYTEKTSVRGATAAGKAAKTAAVEAYMASKEGTQVAVRYVGKGADKTAIGIKDFGKDSLKPAREPPPT